MSAQEITFRLYQIGDRESCVAAFKSNVPQFFTWSEIAAFENFLEKYEHNLLFGEEEQQTFYYVGIHQQKIIACGGFGDRYADGNLTLTWGLVHASFHKRGFGRELLRYRLDALKARFGQFELRLDTTQYAAEFFEKYGFVTEKITRDFYTKGLDRFDMILKKK